MRAVILPHNIEGTIRTAYPQLNEDPMAFLSNDYSEFLRSPYGLEVTFWAIGGE